MSEPWLLFADCETDGLGSMATMTMLEVGFRIVDRDLNTLAERAWVYPYGPAMVDLIRMDADPFVRDMHDASGLWEECRAAGMRHLVDGQMLAGGPYSTLGVLRKRMRLDAVEWLTGNGAKGLPLAGSSVHVDRAWLNDWLPGFSDLIHYRNMDVSTLRILLGEWRTEATVLGPTSRKLHRVMPDLDDTLSELAFYRSILGLTVAAS